MNDGTLTYEGLRDVAKSLAIIDRELLDRLKTGLRKVGEVIEVDASRRFVAYKPDDPWAGRSAESLETRVRPGGAAQALVMVGQRRRSTSDQPRRRPNWGSLQMKHALVPARTAMLHEASDVLEREVLTLMRAHGF